jgi:aspartate aminotransferase
MRLLGKRALASTPSATLELAARANELARAGRPVLNLTVGEPDLPTPAPIVRAAHTALDEGHFGYTPTAGVLELRQRVAAHYSSRWGWELGAEGVIICNGAKQALFNALASTVDPGDRVGVFSPYWTSYVEQIRAVGGEVVEIPCPKEDGFRPDMGAFADALGDGLRLLIVNSPCNPTGAVLSARDWEGILDLLEASECLLLSDEIYEELVFTREGHVSPARLRPAFFERSCIVSGLSKSFAMTGWRVGWALAPAAWTRAMVTLQGHMTSNINAIAQQAAIAALANQELILPLREAFVARRAHLARRLDELTPLVGRVPDGAFYLYLDISALGMDVDAFAEQLLEEESVAIVPGSAFGDAEHVRLSFAASTETLDDAFARMRRFLDRRLAAERGAP